MNTFSDKLNGFWEEGYHYYVEIDNDTLTVRDYARRVMLVTKISYKAESIEKGERTPVILEDSVLSRDASGDPFTMIRTLDYEDGELRMLYYYTIMGETLYTLKKVDHGPFDHIIIRDDEYLEKLQGDWYKWGGDDGIFGKVTVKDDTITIMGQTYGMHVVSYRYDKDSVYIVPSDLTESNFPSYTAFKVEPDRLTATMIVYDASMPLSVFARKDMLDKINVPEAAKRPMVSTMQYRPADTAMLAGMNGFLGMTGPGENAGTAGEKEDAFDDAAENGCGLRGGEAGPYGETGRGPVDTDEAAPVPEDAPVPEADPVPETGNEPTVASYGTANTTPRRFCPQCGHRLDAAVLRFCPDCGSRL
ncbi:MAG: zinc ribbon domain-containing protein [Clostridia bacterium]|nr:zinc ribbon domain-containing protein [Clostridia bacterium]